LGNATLTEHVHDWLVATIRPSPRRIAIFVELASSDLDAAPNLHRRSERVVQRALPQRVKAIATIDGSAGVPETAGLRTQSS
jgi:hypothetical protein